ncbi:NACHT domain-containing protein [Streptomyces sp. NPDC047043]|uniref:NACHT domain-containing protein n=1 Tax=Streptomyces sp. NPDC047043 TaxID=3154497 RepID=UPI0034023433
MPSGNSRLRWAVFGTLAAALLGAAGWLWSAYSLGGLKSALEVVTGVVGLLSPFFVWALRGRQEDPSIGDAADRLQRALRSLSEDIGEIWEEGEQSRRLQDPWPLPVRWAATSRTVVDHWRVIRGSGEVDIPLNLAGALNDVGRVFQRIPSRRLVVLGDAGSGKTVFSICLARALLDTRQSGEPLPVLLPVSSWNPKTHGLQSWIEERLMRDYPYLKEPVGVRSTLAHELVRARLVIPLLDGLDELAEALRPVAIAELNRSLAHRAPLLLTCRGDEYEAAVREADVLTAAAVVELRPLRPEEVRSYLRDTTPRQRVPTWDRVFEEMMRQPQGMIATALSTPLMVSLARTIFGDHPGDPGELLDTSRFPTAPMIEQHLVDSFVPVAYDGGSLREESLRRNRKTHRSLWFLAHHLDRLGTQELAWWELRQAVPRPVLAGAATLAIALVGTLGVGFFFGPVIGPLVGLFGALVMGVSVAVFEPPAPADVQLRSRTRRTPLSQRFTLGVVASGVGPGTAVGLAIFLACWLYGFVGLGALLAPTAAAAVALSGGLIGICALWLWDIPVDVTQLPSPAVVLHRDRVHTLVTALLVGSVFGAVTGAALGIAFAIHERPSLGAQVALGVLAGGGPMAATVAVVSTAWGQFLITRLWLASSRRLPLSVMRFLSEAHAKGVLRQTGGVYRFRHVSLQRRLASTQLEV